MSEGMFAVLAQDVQMCLCQSEIRIVQSRFILIMQHSSPATQNVGHVRPQTSVAVILHCGKLTVQGCL